MAQTFDTSKRCLKVLGPRQGTVVPYSYRLLPAQAPKKEKFFGSRTLMLRWQVHGL
jgi:hypothetical protein